jgi:ribonuclease M5
MPADTVMRSLERAGVLYETDNGRRRRVTKADLYEDGLSGGAGSAARRQKLLALLDLPQRLSSNGLLQVLDAMFTFEEYKAAVARLNADSISG